MRNNNQAIVRKIAVRKLSSDKKRNFFIIAAVALTSLLITSVFSIGMSFYETVRAQRIRAAGTIAHAWIHDVSDEQAEKLKTLDYVKTAGYHSGIGVGKDAAIDILCLDETTWKYFTVPAYSDIVGKYPREKDEIILSRRTLDELGIIKPEIAMEINISWFPLNNNREILFDTVYDGKFRLAGWFTSYIHDEKAYAAQELADKLGITSANWGVIFSNTRNIASDIERLKTDLGNQDIVAGEHVYAENFRAWVSTIAALSLAVSLFVLTGALLIYNVLHISVTNDIRSYGLLKTVGTTPRQIRSIVIGQSVILSAIGIPIGFILSSFASYFLVPKVIASSDVETGAIISFSPLIYIGAALFVFMTTLIGSVVPAKKAAGISPVEAAKYVSGNINRTRVFSRAKGKIYRMALRNIFRERKRAIIVFISLILGITVFMVSAIFVSSIDIDKFANSIKTLKYDFTMKNVSYKRGDTEIVFSGEYMNTVKNLPGLLEMRIISQARYILPHNVSLGMIYGIDKADFTDLSAVLEPVESPLDADAFERGEFALVIRTGAVLTDSDKIKQVDYGYMRNIEGTYEVNGAALNVPIGAFIPGVEVFNNSFGDLLLTSYRDLLMTFSWAIVGAPTIVVSNLYLQSTIDDPLILEIGLNVEKGRHDEAYSLLNQAAGGNKDISMESRWQMRQNVKDAKILITILGNGISLILVLIGVLNFVNSMSVGIVTRKREFAVLESVGMSGKQMRLMLGWEGAVYWILTIAASIIIGTGIAYGLYLLVHNHPMFFPQFIYPILPVAMVFCFIVLICTVTPEICYRSISKMTLVERLRETE